MMTIERTNDQTKLCPRVKNDNDNFFNFSMMFTFHNDDESSCEPAVYVVVVVVVVVVSHYVTGYESTRQIARRCGGRVIRECDKTRKEKWEWDKRSRQ